MAFATDNTIGATFDTVQDMDGGKGFAVGNTAHGSDGRKRVLVQASAAIAALSTGREVTITEPAFTAATGAGGFRAPNDVAVAQDEYFWARESAL